MCSVVFKNRFLAAYNRLTKSRCGVWEEGAGAGAEGLLGAWEALPKAWQMGKAGALRRGERRELRAGGE